MLLIHYGFSLPGWLQQPGWLEPLSVALRHLLRREEAFGLFGVIFVEEVGLPLPVPGDVAIMWAGFMIALHRLTYAAAVGAIVAGSTLGASLNFLVTRSLGQRFFARFGRYMGVDERRLEKAATWLGRWGYWGIIFGRLIPGMRIVLSALAGSLGMPYRVFGPSVVVSATIWALLFVELGRRLGPQTRVLFDLVPAHLLPWLLLFLIVVGGGVYVAYEVRKRRRHPVPAPANPA